jgi:hypothetical protein
MLWEYWTGERIKDEHALRLATQGLDAITWSEGAFESISLWDRLPFDLTIDARGFRLNDCAALGRCSRTSSARCASFQSMLMAVPKARTSKR